MMDGVPPEVTVLLIDGVLSWSRHQQLQEDWMGYTRYQSATVH